MDVVLQLCKLGAFIIVTVKNIKICKQAGAPNLNLIDRPPLSLIFSSHTVFFSLF